MFYEVRMLNYGPENKKTHDEAKVLHTRDEVGRLYVSREERAKLLATIHDSVDRKTWILHKNVEWINTNNQKTKIGRKKCMNIKWKINEISHEKMWTWMRKKRLERETNSFLIIVQNNAKSTNNMKAKIDKTQQNSRCSLCGDINPTINHIREC